MIARKKYFLIISVLSLIISLCINGEANDRMPSLYGNVCLAIAREHVPLGEAVVELLFPDSNKVFYKTYTDSRGYYACYGVSPGKYDIRIIFGKKVMQQLTGQKGKFRNKLRVKVSGRKIVKVPEIIVRYKVRMKLPI